MLGRYRIKRVLGSGSMGSVFLAHDPQLNREVALKVPRMERDLAGELSQRLHREARAAAILSHPNICPIFDVTEDGGTCYIAMGYVAGKPLSAYLGKKVQPEREVAKVVRKIALALEEAHAQGIVHRDLKPSNIMIDKRGEPIVMDFGVACFFDDKTQTRITQQGALVGTPAYMSPEQIEGHSKVGPASDIYSLGVLLYELLAGRCPFDGTVLNVISQVLYQAPPDPRKFRAELSPGLVEIIQRAMQKNPADRFLTMRDFAKALTAFINGTSAAGGEEDKEEMAENEESSLPEPIVATRPKPVRRRETVTKVLPPRTDRAKKKAKSGIPVGFGVIAATSLVVLGVVIGASLVGNRNSPRTSASDHNPLETAELTAANGQVPAPGIPSSPPPPATAPFGDAPAPGSTATTPRAPLAPGSPTSVDASAATKSPAPATVAAAPSSNVTQQPVSASPQSNPRANTAAPLAPGKAVGAVGNPQPRAATNTASEPPAAQSGQRDAPQPADPNRPSHEGADSPDSPPPQRGPRPSPDGDNPPPPRQGGRVSFDGGPKRGVSIEQYFNKLDTNHDGRIDPTELPLHIIFRADTNKDGELTLNELIQAYKKRGQRLFAPPTAAEMRRLPRGGPPGGGEGPPGGGPPGGGPPSRTGGL